MSKNDIPDDMSREEYRETLDVNHLYPYDESIGALGLTTTDAAGEVTAKPTSKVVASTVGAGVGVALANIGVYVIETVAKIDIPEGVELSVGVVLTAGLAYLAGWATKPGQVG